MATTTKKPVVTERNAPIKSLAGKTVGGVQFNQNGYAVPKNPDLKQAYLQTVSNNPVNKPKLNATKPTVTTVTTDTSGSGTDSGGNSFEKDARAYAESQATAQYNANKDAITAMMDRLQKQRESSIKSAEMGAEASRQGLEASAFKAARDAQQASAGRGLLGSGIAADVQARQGMAKQAELAALYGNLNKTTADINTQADLSNAELNQELKTLEANKGAMTEEMYNAQLDRLLTREANQAQFTGKYNGQDTMATKQQNLQNLWATANATGVIGKELAGLTGLKEGSKTLEATNSEASRNIALAQATGKITYTDPTTGKTVTATTQAAKEAAVNSLMKQAELTGVIGADLAKIIGVPAGTPTLTAKKYANDYSLSQAKLKGTGSSGDYQSDLMAGSNAVNDFYNSIPKTDKDGNPIKKSTIDKQARTNYLQMVSQLKNDTRYTPQQKLAMAKAWSQGPNGLGKQAWAEAQKMLGVKTTSGGTGKSSAGTKGSPAPKPVVYNTVDGLMKDAKANSKGRSGEAVDARQTIKDMNEIKRLQKQNPPANSSNGKKLQKLKKEYNIK